MSSKICRISYYLNLFLCLINVLQGLSLQSYEYMLMALFNLACAWLVSFGVKDKDVK